MPQPSRLFVTSLQRDAVVGHAEAIRTQSRKPSKAHTHKKRQPTNASQPHSTRRKEATPQLGRYTCSEQRYHIKPHRRPPGPQAQTSTVPTAGATGTIPAHTQLKTRCRGAAPATPRRPKTRLDTEALARKAWPGLNAEHWLGDCLLYTSPSPRDRQKSRMPSSA